MEIQKNNNLSINWKQMTAKEILQMKDEGTDVPNEYQQWAAAISSVLSVKDDVTYEMVNGETDIAAIGEIFGKDEFAPNAVHPAEDIENDFGKEDEERDDAVVQINLQQAHEKEVKDSALDNDKINTDPNEIMKRKLRRGTPLS